MAEAIAHQITSTVPESSSSHTNQLSRRTSIAEKLLALKRFSTQIDSAYKNADSLWNRRSSTQGNQGTSDQILDEFSQEWLLLERQYVHNMKVFSSVFLRPLRAYYCHENVTNVRREKSAASPSSAFHNPSHSKKWNAHFEALLDCIEQLLRLHSQLLAYLETHDSDNFIAVSSFLPHFKCLYSQYTRHYDILVLQNDKTENKASFSLTHELTNFIKNAELNPSCKGQTFEWFLSLPLNTLHSYHVLLHYEIRDQRVKELFDSFLQSVMIACDHELERWSQEQKMVAISRNLKSREILKVGRIALCEGCIDVDIVEQEFGNRKSSQKRYVYLFSDALAICSGDGTQKSGSKNLQEIIEFTNEGFGIIKVSVIDSVTLSVEIQDRMVTYNFNAPQRNSSVMEEWRHAFELIV